MTLKGAVWTAMIAALLFTSCTTYYISLDSFKQQFKGIDSSTLRKVTISGPGVFGSLSSDYLANPIDTIYCMDKNNHPASLKNGPSIEARFTYGEHGDRVIFYFDRIFVTDSSVTGVRSRIFNSIRKTIPLNSITKIEVQDGHKHYTYAHN